MKKAAIFILIVTALALTPFQAFAKPRVFITLSDFIGSGKYTLYQEKTPEVQQTQPATPKAQASNAKRNIFAKTRVSKVKKH